MFNYAEYKTNILRGQNNQVQTWLWQSGCLILLYFYQTDTVLQKHLEIYLT